MHVPKAWWIGGAIGLLVVAFLPVAADWLRGRAENACALDGMTVDPRLRVRVVNADGNQFQFCALTCAELWLEVSGVHPRAIYVTDEATGDELGARSAYYVRSRVMTHPPTRERRHVFRYKADAQTHAEAFHGRLLTGSQRPFARWFPK
jgi:hypothetical protein